LRPERIDRQDKRGVSVESRELDPLVTQFNSEPWRLGDAERAARAALDRLGHPGTELRLVRLGENALFYAPSLEALLRVARPQKPPRMIAETVKLARLLRAEGVPVAEPLTVEGLDQPVVSRSGTVTLWRYYQEDRSRRVSLGEALETTRSASWVESRTAASGVDSPGSPLLLTLLLTNRTGRSRMAADR
jgi:hypothetical protein